MTPQPAPSFLGIVLNRLRYVFPNATKALVGTFADYASQSTPAAADAIAKHRAVDLHRRLSALETIPYGTPELVGYAMDAHLPIIVSGIETVFMIYRHGIAPEQLKDNGDFRSLVVEVETFLASACPSVSLLRRLLVKGAPFPGSVRYVSSQFQRCADDVHCAPIVAKILRASLVGMYPHAMHIAPLEIRVQTYQKTAKELLAFFMAEGRSSYEYYYMIAEFVYAASRISPLKWYWVSGHARYPEHGTLVCKAGDCMRRGRRPARIAPISGDFRDKGLTLDALEQLLGGRKKLTVACQQVLSPSEIAAVYRDAVCAPKAATVGAVLLAVGGPSFTPTVLRSNDAELRRAYLSLTLREQSIFQVIVHGLLVRESFLVVPLEARIASVQRSVSIARTGSSLNMAILCRACGTWRSKAAVSGLSRGTIGVRIAFPVGHSVQCNACLQTWGIVVVNMAGNAVRARPRIEAQPTWIVMCTACGIPTNTIVYNGSMPICTGCAKHANVFKRGQACFACSAVTGLRSFSAMRNGRTTEGLACASHWPRFSGYETCNIDRIRTRVLSSGQKGYIKKRRHSEIN